MSGGAPTVGGVKRVQAPESDADGRVELGARLRALRDAAGLTVRDAAAAAGVSYGYLSEIETGRKLATLEALDRLCRSYGTLVVDALDGVYPWGARARQR